MYIISVRTTGNRVVTMITDYTNLYYWISMIEDHKEMVKFKVTNPDGVIRKNHTHPAYKKWVDKLFEDGE